MFNAKLVRDIELWIRLVLNVSCAFQANTANEHITRAQ